jgi:hypothetical protein
MTCCATRTTMAWIPTHTTRTDSLRTGSTGATRSSVPTSTRVYTYPGFVVNFETQEGLIGFRRLLSRKLSVAVNAGPMWIGSSNQAVVPNKLTYAANGRVDYTSKPTLIELGYSHGTNGGAGYLLGATWDSVLGNVTRTIGPNVLIGLTGGYDRTAGMINNGTTNNAVGGTQATWQVSRNIIAFVNYTGASQTTTSALPTNAVNQSQILQVTPNGRFWRRVFAAEHSFQAVKS